MPRYVRAFVPGGSFFFTVVLLDRRSALLTQHIAVLREVVVDVRRQRPFAIDAMVVLPDHLHCIWTLPRGDADFSSRWQAIKAHFSARIPRGEPLSRCRVRKGERGVWQRAVLGARDPRRERLRAARADYIHYNPVKHGHAECPSQWPYSSFHRFVARDLYPSDWAATEDVRNLEME